MPIKSLLKYVSNLVDISEDDSKMLIEFFKYANFSKGLDVEEENSVARNLCFITDGFVRTYFNVDGLEITTQIKNTYLKHNNATNHSNIHFAIWHDKLFSHKRKNETCIG